MSSEIEGGRNDVHAEVDTNDRLLDEQSDKRTEAVRVWKEFRNDKCADGVSCLSISSFLLFIVASVMGITMLSSELARSDNEFLLIFIALFVLMLIAAYVIGLLLDRREYTVHFKQFTRKYPEHAPYVNPLEDQE